LIVAFISSHNFSLVVMCTSILFLWVKVVQNTKLIWIQICLHFVKVPKIKKRLSYSLYQQWVETQSYTELAQPAHSSLFLFFSARSSPIQRRSHGPLNLPALAQLTQLRPSNPSTRLLTRSPNAESIPTNPTVPAAPLVPPGRVGATAPDPASALVCALCYAERLAVLWTPFMRHGGAGLRRMKPEFLFFTEQTFPFESKILTKTMWIFKFEIE
jgi:hypothetical protein